MEPDYPAAHSMDSEWFAVDAQGHVGVFVTGEDGHVPEGAALDDNDDILQQLHRFAGDKSDEGPDYGELGVEGVGTSLGLFAFDYEYNEAYAAGLYVATDTPEAPLHVDQLPPRLRELCKRIRFGNVSFSAGQPVQPWEYYTCVGWGDPLCYLCADGKTVRPVAGREAKYREYYEQLCRDVPEAVKQFRFEGWKIPGLRSGRASPGAGERRTPMEADYPAAHSMDTAFFAIDRDGHVGYFRTGEAGAAPAEALAGEEADSVGERLAELVPHGEAFYDLRGRILPGREEAGNRHAFTTEEGWPILMFFDSLGPVQADIDAGRAMPVRASEGTAVVWRRLNQAESKRLHDAGVCRACFWHFHPLDDAGNEAEGYVPALSRHGVYTYGHLTENWISGPYGREEVPAQPVHVDQLPPDVRQALKQVRFDKLSFADTPHVQPVEHAECVSWESAYLDSTGKNIRPIPGREGDYADIAGEMQGMGGEYNVEPPKDDEV
jgi:hypothetical protein